MPSRFLRLPQSKILVQNPVSAHLTASHGAQNSTDRGKRASWLCRSFFPDQKLGRKGIALRQAETTGCAEAFGPSHETNKYLLPVVRQQYMPSVGLIRQTDIFCHSSDNNICPLLAARNRLISSAGRQTRTYALCWPHETDKYLLPVTRQQHMPSAGLTTPLNLLPNNAEQWVRARFFVFPLLCSTTNQGF